MSTRILIADAIKPSLVMSSEVFKDKIAGSTVFVAGTGKDALEIAAREKPDIVLVDFDLPDVDGPALVIALRKVFQGPILMTAYPDENVSSAVRDHLFAYNDASSWIKKPVKFDELSEKIDQFLVARRRTGRRFSMELPTRIVGRAEGRGKRAPKASGKVVNMSLGGVCIQLEGAVKLKKKQEITLSITFPKMTDSVSKLGKAKVTEAKAAPKKAAAKSGAKKSKKASNPGVEATIKATVAWVDKAGQLGLSFAKLSEAQMEGLEDILRLESYEQRAA